MDHKLANVLYRKIKQRSCGRDSTEADIPTRIDEYLSPRMCCIAPSKIGSNESIFCSEPLWYQYKTRLDWTMVLKRCNLASITRYVLRFQQRPRWFIRPSRRQRPSGEMKTTVEPFRSPEQTSTGVKIEEHKKGQNHPELLR
ncbi:hypothetical protein VTP01DRAFT_9776 [Rhizomucor pusillus]|uniref:uncharacterized protein n=1 Tax=Rhizomucor pusillus TaxID=4840 RepID=UPI0037428EFE